MSDLTPFQHRLLEVLRHGTMTAREIVESVYTDANGGPLSAEVAIRVQIHRLRRKGVEVRFMGRRHGYAVADSVTANSKG